MILSVVFHDETWSLKLRGEEHTRRAFGERMRKRIFGLSVKG